MYKVQKVIMLSIKGEQYESYHLLKDGLPIYTVNSYLNTVGNNSINTVKQYAYRLCRFFNFLEKRKKTYKIATKKDILNFVDYLLFDIKDGFYIGEGKVTYLTLSHYLTVIKEFYRYLEDTTDTEIKINVKRGRRSSKKLYSYGHIWDIDISKVLEKRIHRTKGSKENSKWYSEEEKKAIISNFNTLRDKAVFLLTLEGLRIDEAVSVRIDDYNPLEKKISLYKSKGKPTGNVGESVYLSSRTVKELDNYIYNERDSVLILLQEKDKDFPNHLFINIKDNRFLGEPLSYRNYLNILKSSSVKAGLDPSEIGTHNGRRTKTMELLYHQVEHPEDNVTDEHIRQLMRWSSPDSIKPYINTKDKRLAIESAKKINNRKKNEVHDGQKDKTKD